MMSRRQIEPSAERGFVIIAVLWILVALSALAAIFSVYLSSSARALGITDIGVEAEALVSAGLELTAYQLLLADDDSRPAQGSFRFRMDSADVFVSFTSEAARVDLNTASKEMLAGLFEVLGAPQKTAGEIADRIDGWRMPPKPNAADDEGALYLASGLAYSPRQAPFAHVNELSLVLGASPAMVERALPYLTVFSKSAEVDVLIAPPEVIAALPGMTPQVLNDFLKQRPSLPRDQKAIAAALGPAKAAATLPAANVFRVMTTLRFDNGRRLSSEAVISLGKGKAKGKGNNKDNAKDSSQVAEKNSSQITENNSSQANDKDKEPYRVLSWQDEVETTAGPLKQAGR
jgi:general secretion pathway protein K